MRHRTYPSHFSAPTIHNPSLGKRTFSGYQCEILYSVFCKQLIRSVGLSDSLLVVRYIFYPQQKFRLFHYALKFYFGDEPNFPLSTIKSRKVKCFNLSYQFLPTDFIGFIFVTVSFIVGGALFLIKKKNARDIIKWKPNHAISCNLL